MDKGIFEERARKDADHCGTGQHDTGQDMSRNQPAR